MWTKTSRFVRFFSFFLTLTLVFVSISTPAYAMRPQQFGAWVAAAIQALNITVGSTLIPAADLGQRFSDYLNYPVKINASQVIDVPYTFSDADIQEELNKSVIKIDKDSVTIDGVKYTDVWLSNDAAEKFRVNAFDIENAFDLTSHSEGTFVEGVGHAGSLPLFNVNGSVKSQEITTSGYGTFNTGPINVEVTESGITGQPFGITYVPTWGEQSVGYTRSIGDTRNYYQRITDSRLDFFSYLGNNTQPLYRRTIPNDQWDNTPFDFDWTSGTIPADKVLEPNEGLRIRVPTDAINQWYVDNPSFGPNVTINMGDPELSTKIDDLIDLIIPLIPVLDIDFTEDSDPAHIPEPIPDPEPYPDPLPDPDITLIDSKLEDIIKALKNIFDNISIGNSIITAIKNLADQIKWVLDDILDKIGDLVDKIVKGNIDWFSDLIDAIKKPFLPWLNIFKLGVNIWHYVVDWVQNISAPFSYFWNILGSVSPIFYSPIYAVAAASIVIAIYRRFGR